MEQLMQFISDYKAIIILVAILIGLGVITSMIKSIKRNAKRAANRIVNNAINRATRNVLGAGIDVNDIKTLINATKDAADEPEKKSVFGATNLYLPKIEKDFADFHNMEAIAAIKIFMNEYLDIAYGEKKKFQNSNVEPGLETMINVSNVKSSTTNVNIHNTAISNYIKTNEYATITYQVAVGYNTNSERKEERYKIEYTMKLKTNGIAEETMKCDNCGASIDSTSHENCPYCDARIIRDTRMSWKFTSISKS